MMNKKAIEISVNFFVILVISIVVFVGGIVLTSKFMNIISGEEARIDREMESKIRDIFMDGYIVAIPIDTYWVRRGNFQTIGLGVYNTLSDGTDEFRVAMSFRRAYDTINMEMDAVSNPPAPDCTDTYCFIDENWIFGREDQSFSIGTNQYELVPLVVTVDGNMDLNKKTRSGTYEFNVCVCPCYEDNGCDDTNQNYCKDICRDPAANRQYIYGNHVMKVYIIVP